MEVFEAIKKRRSIREYTEEQISNETMEQILDAGISAPSAGNLQSWEFILIRDQKKKEMISEAAYNQTFLSRASVLIVVCGNQERSAYRYGSRGKELYCIQDTSAAIQNMLLASASLGIGTCWVGAFNENAVRKILKIPAGVRPVAIISLGYGAEKPGMPRRMNLKDVVHYEEF
ncbi:MAG: hypothetical protein A7316_06645 [Candidatus Altiarchaeales archaeon WOR_SM1_86-2]|nr:MAG: hypothetical protein A7316_06645 [Candidatus Altiarchaeales archaeon WOR_SM1_86-2]ODS41387.1 MAG: hypothetical protein A7315_06400 [Candidatus Altiarchaeales archaeon WOR_SM1_79]